MKSSPYIVCAAIKYDDILILGPRHFDSTMRAQITLSKRAVATREWEQGFIDQHGEFYDRVAAMHIVLMNKQPFNLSRNGGQMRELFSEGLY